MTNDHPLSIHYVHKTLRVHKPKPKKSPVQTYEPHKKP